MLDNIARDQIRSEIQQTAFRHFFRHAYAHVFQWDEMRHLVERLPSARVSIRRIKSSPMNMLL